MEEEILITIKNAEKKAKNIIELAEAEKKSIIEKSIKEADLIEKNEIQQYHDELKKEEKIKKERINELKSNIENERLENVESLKKKAEKNTEKVMNQLVEKFEVILKEMNQ